MSLAGTCSDARGRCGTCAPLAQSLVRTLSEERMRAPVCLLLTVLLADASAQEQAFTFEHALRAGPALLPALPQARWIPGTRTLALLRTDGHAASNHQLLHLVPGAEATPV